MPTGSTKSLHFQGFDEIERSGQTRKRLDPRRPVHQETVHGEPDTPETPSMNPLLAMGNLIRDHQLIGQKLKMLHLDEAAYHGNLQVVFTALYRMQKMIAGMIEQCEED